MDEACETAFSEFAATDPWTDSVTYRAILKEGFERGWRQAIKVSGALAADSRSDIPRPETHAAPLFPNGVHA